MSMNRSDEWIVRFVISYLTKLDSRNELKNYIHFRRGSCPSLHSQVLSQATKSRALL